MCQMSVVVTVRVRWLPLAEVYGRFMFMDKCHRVIESFLSSVWQFCILKVT